MKRDDVLAVVKNDELPLKLEQAKAELNEKRQNARMTRRRRCSASMTRR